MRILSKLVVATAVVLLWGCTAKETVVEGTDFAFDGTCVNCHAGLTAGHVHTNYKLRCVDCHGGDDQVDVPRNAYKNTDLANGGGGFRDPDLMEAAHVKPKGFGTRNSLARYFYANGIDDNGDGVIDEPTDFQNIGQTITTLGEVFEPGLHGEGPGEFMDAELNRDLNYTRFLNPGDLRVASVGCGAANRQAGEQGGGCHQETIDIVRRSMMVNQAAVTNGAYYGNESWDIGFQMQRDKDGKAEDPRFGAFGYALDYDAGQRLPKKPSNADLAKICVKPPADPKDPRSQPTFDSECLEARASSIDCTQGVSCSVAANAPGNVGNPAFEIAQGTIKADEDLLASGLTAKTVGAGDSRWAGWGGQEVKGDAHAELAPLQNRDLPGALTGVIPDPVDNILRTFRAYYPLNYPASTTNFNFTFGTSILPNIARFRTANPYGRGHSSGCAACHTPYNYAGNREPQRLRQETLSQTLKDDNDIQRNCANGFCEIDDPTTKHREFDPANDQGPVDVDTNGDGIPDTIQERLIGRPVGRDEVFNSFGVARGAQDLDGDGQKDGEQQKTYSRNHQTTTKIDTDTCGLCHGFVTRINYAYQGAAEDEQRDVLARRKPIEFTTPQGTQVRIVDSWVREDNDVDNNGVKDAVPTIVRPEGVAIVEKARERDAKLLTEGCKPGQRFPECGLAAGAGGCAQNTFSEDCNNNGELDKNLVLERRDLDGNVIASVTINEDLNGNGKLDLIDRVPRENAIDGRQVRYVYGGRNGSTRQMDVHFERGMHCIDCHFMQDVHGDGNIYSTNWDAIEIECEDCHGANARTNFKTSGPNGGNDLRLPVNENLEPFFEEINGKIIQRSRVNTGVFWVVPQTIEANGNPYAREAHDPEYHIADPGSGSEFAGEQGQSELTRAKVECATCHNGWITNCVGCHVEINVGDAQRNKINNVGGVLSVEKSAGENEIWMSNAHNKGHQNFQLLTLLRAPFTMGVGPNTEKGRLSLFRSSMQVTVNVGDGNGDTLRDSLTFTTFQNIDGNSGRTNVATSGVAMNITMAHTVRPNEARGCELCHSLVDTQGRTRNEHLMAQSFGVGAGSIAFLGDWAMAAGANGIELFEYKDEKELVNQINPLTVNQRFPGHIVNPANVAGDAGDRRAANVEPNFAGTTTVNDIVLIRNFNPTPPLGQTTPPTLRDFAILAVNNNNVTGEIVVSDISARGHPSAVRPNLNNTNLVASVALNCIPTALAHLAPDVSDPFVYVACGTGGLRVIRVIDAPLIAGGPIQAQQVGSIAIAGKNVTEITMAGDLLYVGTAEGDVIAFTIGGDGSALTQAGSFQVGARVNEIALSGFALYVATDSGLKILALDDVGNPSTPAGGSNTFVPNTAPAKSVAVSEGHAIVAVGAPNSNVVDVDARTIADPKPGVSIVPGANTVNDPRDVVVSQLPGQRWFLVLEGTGDLVGIKQDGRLAWAEKCYQDPGGSNCLLEFQMYDPTRSGRDPSFDPVTQTFDTGLVGGKPIDPSAIDFFRMTGNILNSGTRMVRPVTWETLNTLSGRRYRDSFMPGSGTISLQVMQAMRSVLVCEVDPVNHEGSTNPSGLGELGYADPDGNCTPFGKASAKRKGKKVCTPGVLGNNLRQLVCGTTDLKTAEPQPAKPEPTAPVRPVKSAALVPTKH